MNWSSIWPARWFRAKSKSAARKPSKVQLAVEQLEDRLVLTAVASTGVSHQVWAQQTFQVNDATLQSVSPGPTTQATALPQNASFGSMIGLPTVFGDYPYRGAGYSVAVIDTGIDYLDPALGGGFGPGHKVIAGWNFVNNTANPMDDNGHGSVVAGEIGASDATYSGVAPDVNLIALKVLDASGSGTFGNVQNALDWVVANRTKYNIVAVNMSLGSGNYTINPYTFLDTDLSSLKGNGVFISVAAGNSFYSLNSVPGLDYPAIDPNVASVGAVYDGNFGAVAWASGARDNVTAPDLIASFSQRSSALSILAPGAMVTSTYLNDTYQEMAGTSMAAPVIAGAAVILHEAMDALHLPANETTILSLMQKTGVTIVDDATADANVKPTGLNFDRIDLAAALEALGSAPVAVAPVLQPIANQSVSPGGKTVVALSASDANGNAITFSAVVVGAASSQAYQLKQTLGLKATSTYFTNVWGANEKWLPSIAGIWYCILPNGQLYRCAGSLAATLQPANQIAALATSFYANPSLLWNAQAPAGPSVAIAGNQLTIQAPAGTTGSYQIQVTASDGSLSSSQAFTLTIQASTTPPSTTPPSTTPQIGAIANQSMLTNRSQTLTLSTTGAANSSLTFNAKVVGTFAAIPACLVVTGNQLTIYTSPDYVGTFSVQVTAANGALTSTTTFQVTVAAAPVAYRFTGDFNGDGVQDTAFFNQDGSWWVSLNTKNGTFVNQNWLNWSPASNWASVQIGDFNGDGKTDILGVTTAGSIWVGTSTGTSFNSQLWGQWSAASTYKTILVGDFTGDDKTDILGFTTGGAIWVGVSTGTSFTSTLWGQWSPASTWTTIASADVDGDGKIDLFGQNANGHWYVAYSTGTGFTTKLWTGANPP